MDCLKNEQQAEKQRFEGKCDILRTIFQLRALSSDIPASQKGFYLFYNPLHHFSRRAHADRSCILWIFRVFLCRIVNQFLNFSITSFYKKYSFVFHDQLKVQLERLLVSRPFEIKSDNVYQIVWRIPSDNHCPIWYHVISFIQ